MKKLFLEVGMLVVLLIGTYLILTSYVERHFVRPNYYMTMSLVKEKRLQSLKGPKLVLMGGSNVLFGFDSKLLQQRSHTQVVNMGLHAGLGLTFLLNESIGQVGRNDTIILCPEYFVNSGDINSQVELLSVNAAAQPYFDYALYDQLRVYSARFQRSVAVPFSFLGKLPKVPRTYSVDNLNAFGDIERLYSEDKKPIKAYKLSASGSDAYVEKINRFVDEARLKGAVVYLTFPAYCESEFKLNERIILALEQLFREKLHCPLLGSARAFVYPDQRFFDSVYHLNQQARTARTEQVIDLLNRQ